MMKTKGLFILSYGCQMNLADSERMAGELATIGYKNVVDINDADMILLNTCCVRETAEDKVYGKIGELKQLKKSKPQLIIGVCGCMAQKEGDALIKRAPHLDFVLGTNKIFSLVELVKELEQQRHHIVSVMEGGTDAAHKLQICRSSNSFSAWIPVMYGCDNFCTYCIVPYVRGRERSRLPEDVIAEVQEAVLQGYKEITLLGQNVNSYGKDHKQADFADLLLRLDELDGIERIRYMTSHPKDLSDKMIEAIANSKHICEHFHLPLQYGSNEILRRMNRKYTIEKYMALVEKIRQAVPHASLTTDLIVGFPGETERDFSETLEAIREIRYDAAYTFIYSKRSGTPAANMVDQVPDEIKHDRLQKLMALQNEISLQKNKEMNGKTVEVMVEGPSRTDECVWTGRTRTNKIVLWPAHGTSQPGDLVKVKINQPQTWVLKGELV